eukprot:TRINITY_DN9751_c0_g1_i3.p1 TRINITY_DN9751_c0_g1~~TRINITY_DN9751_c0_g1_i3.p1  ORF type:complete len:124 (+),score=8.21 TRINITY_DN9751_c0_g1_i3:47-418(+)
MVVRECPKCTGYIPCMISHAVTKPFGPASTTTTLTSLISSTLPMRWLHGQAAHACGPKRERITMNSDRLNESVVFVKYLIVAETNTMIKTAVMVTRNTRLYSKFMMIHESRQKKNVPNCHAEA